MPPKKPTAINNTRNLRSRAGVSTLENQQSSATPPRIQQTLSSSSNQQISFSTPTPAEESLGMRIVDEIIKKSRKKIFQKVFEY